MSLDPSLIETLDLLEAKVSSAKFRKDVDAFLDKYVGEYENLGLVSAAVCLRVCYQRTSTDTAFGSARTQKTSCRLRDTTRSSRYAVDVHEVCPDRY